MLRLEQRLGNIEDTHINEGVKIDTIPLQWYESYRRIGRHTSSGGLDIGIAFSKPLIYGLNEGDILYLSDKLALVVSITPCEALSIAPQNTLEIAKFCYEIGNGHIPLFYSKNTKEFLTPYEKSLEKSLANMGFISEKKIAKLHAKNRFYVSMPMQREPKLKISSNLHITKK